MFLFNSMAPVINLDNFIVFELNKNKIHIVNVCNLLLGVMRFSSWVLTHEINVVCVVKTVLYI